MKYINLEYHPADSRVRIVDDDVSQTLSSRMGTGGQRADNINYYRRSGGGVIRWNYNELSPTLRGEMGGHPPEVVLENETDNTDREAVL